MKNLIKPAVYGILAALGIVLIAIGMEAKPVFTWSQIALIVGGFLVLITVGWVLKYVIGILPEDV